MPLTHLLSFSRRLRASRLPNRLEALKERIRPTTEAREALDQVQDLNLRIDSSSRWDSWGQLVRIDRRCARQLLRIKRAQKALKLAAKSANSMDATLKADIVSVLRGWPRDRRSSGRTTRHSGDTTEKTTAAVGESLLNAGTSWNSVRAELKSNVPNVLLTHAFLMVSKASRVEVTSLFVGALVGLGALYTQAFYLAAIGTSAWPYFTLEDLVDQGIQSLWLAVFVLLVLELLFWLARRFFPYVLYSPRRGTFVAHTVMLRRPGFTAFVLVLLTAFATWQWGTLRGEIKLGNFARMTPNLDDADAPRYASGQATNERRSLLHKVVGRESPAAEMATVMDGTELRDVYLVGTTARTATFLQVCDWGTEENAKVTLGPCTRGEKGSSEDGGVRTGRVLVMDRALVVCHSEGEACINQDGRGLAGVVDRRSLEDRRRELLFLTRTEQPDAVEREVLERLDSLAEDIDEHLNRHHRQLLMTLAEN